MIYGNPAWEHMERIKNSIFLKEWIRAGYFLPLLSMTPPCEMTTQQELHYLVQRSLLVTPEKLEMIQQIEHEHHVVWAEYLNTLGITTTPEFVFSLMDKYEVIIDYLKVKFNRPRPFQTAGYYGIPLYPRLRSDAYDSAYPSGHTFLALVVYDYFARQHPDLQKELMLMVLKVKQSREDGGVHYPSDGLFAFQVYQHLKHFLHQPMTPDHPIDGTPTDPTVQVQVQVNVQLPEGKKGKRKKLRAYTDPNWITDRAPVSDYVDGAREVGRGTGAVAQGETKHIDI